jgi:hypothetical protein
VHGPSRLLATKRRRQIPGAMRLSVAGVGAIPGHPFEPGDWDSISRPARRRQELLL